jgi:hypothetical protein
MANEFDDQLAQISAAVPDAQPERAPAFEVVESTQLGNISSQQTNTGSDALVADVELNDVSNVLTTTAPVTEIPESPSVGYSNIFDKTIEQIGAELRDAGVTPEPDIDR